jgi:hypothetical protein
MKRTLALAWLVLSVPAIAAPTPILSGLYSVGELGLVEFSLADGKVIGKMKSSQQCVFAHETSIVTGAFEGDVFVGTVNLCQDGSSCAATRTYQILGVFHEGAVAAWVHLDPGCTSPALDRNTLFLRPATLEEKQKVLGTNSASAVAQKMNKKELAVLAAEALADGNRLLSEQKFGPAREKFKQSVEANESWEALLGLGTAEIKLNRLQESLAFLDRALTVAQSAKASGTQISQVHYNRACAEVALGDKKAALTSLRTAIKLGGAQNYLDALTSDADLQKLRGESEFRRFVAETQMQSRKKPR